ncbi:hypothetical protein GW813_12995, partial [bacterium]|nr:hypothetical protein [bacterium]
MQSGRDKDRPLTGAVSPGTDETVEPQGDFSLNEGQLREMGYQMVDLAVEYLKGLEGRRVYGPVSPVGLDEMFSEPLPDEGVPFADLVQDCRTRVFPNTMGIGGRRYFGMMNPAPLPVA